MVGKFLSSLRSIPLTKAATIINWVCFTPILLAGLWGWLTDDMSAILHPIPMLALVVLGFGYALLLSLDSGFELFRDRPLFNGAPRWLWRWICAGFGFLMLALIFLSYVSPLR